MTTTVHTCACGFVGTMPCPRCGWINAAIRSNHASMRRDAATRERLDAMDAARHAHVLRTWLGADEAEIAALGLPSGSVEDEESGSHEGTCLIADAA